MSRAYYMVRRASNGKIVGSGITRSCAWHRVTTRGVARRDSFRAQIMRLLEYAFFFSGSKCLGLSIWLGALAMAAALAMAIAKTMAIAMDRAMTRALSTSL